MASPEVLLPTLAQTTAASVITPEDDQQVHLNALAHSELAHNTFKKMRLQHNFDYVASFLILGFVGIIFWYNWLMIAPHLTPILWAALFAILLWKPLIWVTTALAYVDEKISDVKLKIYITSASIYLLLLITSSLLTIVITSCVFALWSFLLFGDRRSVGVLIVFVILFVMLGLPSYYIISTCVNESAELAAKIQAFVEKNPEFQTLLTDFGDSYYYKWCHDYAAQWGVELPAYDPEVVKSKIIEISMQFSAQLTSTLTNVLSIVSNGVQIVVAFITFLSTLYYFLLNIDTLATVIPDLSPFSEEDSQILYDALSRTVVQIFVSSWLIFTVHLLGTYFIFSITGVDLALVLSVLAGFTSVLPVVGSYGVWIPVAIAQLATGQTLNCILVVTMQLILQFPVDLALYARIPGNSFIISFGLAAGMSLFGILGVLLGPLLAGISITIIDMYGVYQRMPRLKVRNVNEIEVDLKNIDRTLSLTATPSFNTRRSNNNKIASEKSNQKLPPLPVTPSITCVSESHQ